MSEERPRIKSPPLMFVGVAPPKGDPGLMFEVDGRTPMLFISSDPASVRIFQLIDGRWEPVDQPPNNAGD